jgi:hypothetical protein
MTQLKEGTTKIVVTEAALKVLGERKPGRICECDICLTWVAPQELGYQDETRTECKGCHAHDWRCQDDWDREDDNHGLWIWAKLPGDNDNPRRLSLFPLAICPSCQADTTADQLLFQRVDGYVHTVCTACVDETAPSKGE